MVWKYRLISRDYTPVLVHLHINRYDPTKPDDPTDSSHFYDTQQVDEKGVVVKDFECFVMVNNRPKFKAGGKARLKELVQAYYQDLDQRRAKAAQEAARHKKEFDEDFPDKELT